MLIIKLALFDFKMFGSCWIGSFGFDRIGNVYGRKKIN